MPNIDEFSDEPGKVWKLTGPNSISSPGGDAPEPDWAALAAQAEVDHRAANERYAEALTASQSAAFRQLVFSSAAAGCVKVCLSPSDQGDHMGVDWAEDENGEDMLDTPLDNDLHDGASDLSDYGSSPWLEHEGLDITPDAQDGLHTVVIDIKVAAAALIADQPAPERELNIGTIVYYLNKEHGINAFLEDTGGGTLAIYAGQPFDADEHGDQRFPALAGPGHHSRQSDRPVFTFDELYLGQDDEGETDPLTIHPLVNDERDVATLIAAQARLRRRFVLTEASARTHLYAARTRTTNS